MFNLGIETQLFLSFKILFYYFIEISANNVITLYHFIIQFSMAGRHIKHKFW